MLTPFLEFVETEKAEAEHHAKDFFSKNIDIPRKEMPQIKGACYDDFKAWLGTQGIKYDEKFITPKFLYASQKHLNIEKVIAIIRGKKYLDKNGKPVISTKDGYVLDGHHRVLAARTKNAQIKTLCVEIPIESALETITQYPKVEYHHD